MNQCRSCGAQIEWAITEAGKRMPVEHDEGGNLAVWDTPTEVRCRVLILDGEPQPPERRAVSHFAVCPHADAHRRPR